ncbi:hypothetical protein NECAME_04196 [Necator americanus]|uniref:Uncharacterized protein n=1 Tax=Necator americanus TaxID=51031 RepID=W2SW46_NECAM|nr:hypothetical protein NECAME_04196 [Necator americanus]ETN73974.1 hypothetical protein NECAME_04196 [Necator americanus]
MISTAIFFPLQFLTSSNSTFQNRFSWHRCTTTIISKVSVDVSVVIMDHKQDNVFLLLCEGWLGILSSKYSCRTVYMWYVLVSTVYFVMLHVSMNFVAACNSRMRPGRSGVQTTTTQDSGKKSDGAATENLQCNTAKRSGTMRDTNTNSVDLEKQQDFDDYLNALGEADGKEDAGQVLKGDSPAVKTAISKTCTNKSPKTPMRSKCLRNTMENVPVCV